MEQFYCKTRMSSLVNGEHVGYLSTMITYGPKARKKKKKFAPNRIQAIEEEIEKLLKVEFIREV